VRKLKTILFLSLFLPGAVFGQAGAPVAAKILSIQGQVEVQQSPWAPATVNMILKPGAAIRTGPQSRAVVLLADETQIKLNASSELVIKEVRQASNLFTRVVAQAAKDQSTLSLVKGEAWLRAKLKPVNASVSTPAVTAAIRGTEFDIKVADDGETFTTVLEGSVDMRNDQGFVLVNSGEQGRARVGQAPTKTVILNPQDAVQWTLFYTAAVSPRDYPFIFASPAQAKADLAAAKDPVRIAQLQHDAGNPQAALNALQGQTSPEAAATRGWILLEQNRIREALEELYRAQQQAPRVRLGLSLAHFRLNQFSESYKYVQDPGTDDQLKLQKAMLDLMAGDAASARTLLENVPGTSPSYALVQGLLSNVYLTQNSKDKALAAAQRGIQADPNSPSARLNLSLVQQSMFDLPGATRSVEKALELDPDFLQADIQYAKLLYGAGNSGKAEEVARRALTLAPEEAGAHSTLGFILLGRGQTDEARVSFERSLQYDNSRGEPHLGLGIAYMRQGRTMDATSEFLTATSLEPRISLYQSYLGKAFYEQRKFEQAFTALEAAKELDPRDPTPRLYSGIFENDLNRPGQAVKDLEESIRLNDNRAVYRSRFVLDQDSATRNVNLATSYNRLGLSEWANLQALKSNISDPANSSAHIFLANTFNNLKGRRLATGSELLIARLLLPVNANSFNAFNDYTTLFELPRLNWTTESTGGSFSAVGSRLIASGGSRRYAYSSVLDYSQTDGFRPVNDDSRNYTGTNFFKFALTPHSDLLFSFIHTQTRQGDHGGGSPLVNDQNSESRRQYVRSSRAEIGYHYQIRPGSEVVMVFSGQTNYLVIDDPKSGQYYVPGYLPVNVQLRRDNRTPDLDFQASHFFKVSKLSFKYGLDIFEGRARIRDTFIFPNPYSPGDLIIQDLEPDRYKVRFKTVFLQTDYAVTSKFTLTGGVNYDWANYKLTNNLYDQPIGKWNPQGGFMFSPFESTTFRFAAMRVLQTYQQERLVPTHLDGFIFNQNEGPLTLSNSYNFGWDQRFSSKTFLRTWAFKRDRTIPTLGTTAAGDPFIDNFYGNFYGSTITLNQFITERWTIIPEYSLTHSKDTFGIRHDHEANLGMYYIHPRGYSIGVKENYLDQHGLLGQDLTSVSVYTTDVSLSYEFPHKRALFSLNVTNLTDRRYAYLADPLARDPRVPKRQLAALLRFNF
jgi:tetratricopeptide (TPR) repeat protein